MIPPKHHRQLKVEKWFSFPMHQHILMIAAELNRAKNWIEKNDYHHVDLCYERALELVDLTVSDPKWKGRTRELLRFREMAADLYIQPQKDKSMNYLLYKTLISLLPGSYNMLFSHSGTFL